MALKKLLGLWVNQALVIECENGMVYHSQVVKEEDDFVYINQPLDKDLNPMQMENERSVMVYFYNENNEMFAFRSILRFSDGKIYLAKPDGVKIRKVQRRHYFRVPTTLHVTIDFSSEESETYNSHDIGGGGFTFLSKNQNPFQMRQEVKGTIFTDDAKKEEIPFKGTVVGMRTTLSQEIKIAVSFTEINESLRSDIIRYCMKRQIEIRDKLGST